jgi:hypothetical protein
LHEKRTKGDESELERTGKSEMISEMMCVAFADQLTLVNAKLLRNYYLTRFGKATNKRASAAPVRQSPVSDDVNLVLAKWKMETIIMMRAIYLDSRDGINIDLQCNSTLHGHACFIASSIIMAYSEF